MESRQHGQPGRPQRAHQRFSWQVPPPEEPAPHYSSQSQQQSAQHTQNSRAFSYVQTPIEHRAPQLGNAPPLPQPQSPHTPIDPRPQSVYNPHHPAIAQPQVPLTVVPPSQTWLPSQSFPATQSPVSVVQPQQDTAPQSHHVRQRSTLSPINTDIAAHNMPPLPQTPYSQRGQASPLPLKAPVTPGSATLPHQREPSDRLPTSPSNKKSFAMEPYSPHALDTPKHSVFSPDAPTGPNGLDFALHQPGQIAHPNMDLSAKGTHHEWKHSLCECSGDMGTCMTGLFCPCILYGRTAYRLTKKSEKKDPTDMLGHQTPNGHCGLMAVACGLWCESPLRQPPFLF